MHHSNDNNTTQQQLNHPSIPITNPFAKPLPHTAPHTTQHTTQHTSKEASTLPVKSAFDRYKSVKPPTGYNSKNDKISEHKKKKNKGDDDIDNDDEEEEEDEEEDEEDEEEDDDENNNDNIGDENIRLNTKFEIDSDDEGDHYGEGKRKSGGNKNEKDGKSDGKVSLFS